MFQMLSSTTIFLMFLSLTLAYWELFKQRYHKNFSEVGEDDFRKTVFEAKLLLFNAHSRLEDLGIRPGTTEPVPERWTEPWFTQKDYGLMDDQAVRVIVDYWEKNFIEEACWELFKRKFNRTYVGEQEAFRRAVFADRVRKFKEHNQLNDLGIVTNAMGVNQFTDQTDEEFEKMKMHFNRT